MNKIPTLYWKKIEYEKKIKKKEITYFNNKKVSNKLIKKQKKLKTIVKKFEYEKIKLKINWIKILNLKIIGKSDS